MHVLVIDTWLLTPHLETGMEIALLHRKKGDMVTYINIGAILPFSDEGGFTTRWYFRLTQKLRRAHTILRKHGVEVLKANDFKLNDLFRPEFSVPKSKKELLSLGFDGYPDLGLGAWSSLLSWTRRPNPDPSEYRKLLKRIILSGSISFNITNALLTSYNAENRINMLYTFNGRFSSTRGIIRAAETLHTPWRTHERGCDIHHFRVDDQPIHDFSYIQQLVRAHWQDSDKTRNIGRNFFKNRRDRVETNWYSFTKDQLHGTLPKEIGDEPFVVFFLTSEDEFAATVELISDKAFKDQMQMVQVAAQACHAESVKLIVRVHPHVTKKHIDEYHRWMNLDLTGAIVVAPESTVDSYALMDAAEAVITSGSTTGLEATYWRRPSILMGPSFYDRSDIVTTVHNSDELRSAIRERRVWPLDNALKFGYFLQTYGQAFKFYEAESFYEGRFLGKDLSLSVVRRPIKILVDFYRKERHRLLRLTAHINIPRGSKSKGKI